MSSMSSRYNHMSVLSINQYHNVGVSYDSNTGSVQIKCEW